MLRKIWVGSLVLVFMASGSAFGEDSARFTVIGKIGVGTTSPAATLQVKGDAALGGDSAATYSDFGTTVYSVGSIAGDLNISGANNRAITSYVKGTYSGDSPIRVFRGYGQIPASNSNAISGVNGMTFWIEHLGSGELTNVALYGGSLTLNNAAATVSNLYGLQLFDSNVTAGTLTNASGINIRKFSAAGNNTQLLSGTETIPSGNFGLYEASGYTNYFAGNVGIGTTGPAEKLDVVGNVRIDGTLNVTGNPEITGLVTATDGFAGGDTFYYGNWIRI